MPNTLAQAMKDFEHFLLEKQLRLTSQRRKIVEVAFSIKESFTAEGLADILRRKYRMSGRATVYRTLKLMAESGLLKTVDTGVGGVSYLSHFSRKTALADIICEDCGHIETLEAPFLEWYVSAAAQRCGLKASEGRLQIKGRCRKALEGGECPHKR